MQSRQDVSSLQGHLSQLQIDREKLESDYRRMGGISRNKQQIEKKRQVESQLDDIDRQV